MPDIACILIHYRYPELTTSCLQSLQEAGIDGFKIFLVDNSARDGTGETAAQYMRDAGMPYSHLKPLGNLGFAGGANLGLRAALAEGISHVLFLNNDVWVFPEFTREALAAVRRYPDDVLAGSILDARSGKPSFSIGYFSPFTGQVRHILDAGFGGEIHFVSGTLMIAPSAVFQQIGTFDDAYFMYCEDMDLCWRLREHGIRMRYCSSIRVRHATNSTALKSSTPYEYYRVRNQTFTILRRAKAHQKALYLLYLGGLVAHRLLLRRHAFRQAFRGARDGLLGRMGKRHRDSPPPDRNSS